MNQITTVRNTWALQLAQTFLYEFLCNYNRFFIFFHKSNISFYISFCSQIIELMKNFCGFPQNQFINLSYSAKELLELKVIRKKWWRNNDRMVQERKRMKRQLIISCKISDSTDTISSKHKNEQQPQYWPVHVVFCTSFRLNSLIWEERRDDGWMKARKAIISLKQSNPNQIVTAVDGSAFYWPKMGRRC